MQSARRQAAPRRQDEYPPVVEPHRVRRRVFAAEKSGLN
jgi:hypothetical protein